MLPMTFYLSPNLRLVNCPQFATVSCLRLLALFFCWRGRNRKVGRVQKTEKLTVKSCHYLNLQLIPDILNNLVRVLMTFKIIRQKMSSIKESTGAWMLSTPYITYNDSVTVPWMTSGSRPTICSNSSSHSTSDSGQEETGRSCDDKLN